jgi:glutamate/aspartate transport system permease protein
MNYHWNWGIFLEQVKAGDETYLAWLFTGLGWTLAVSLTAWLIALTIGIAVGALRTAPSRLLVLLANAWVELFRNIPLLVQMFLWFFVVPEFLPREWSLWVKQEMPAKEFLTAALCLGFFTSARVAEQVRAGVGSLPRGQRDAAAGARPDADAGLPAGDPAAGAAHRHSAADVGIHERVQEFLGGLRHRRAGTHLPGAADAGGFRAGHRNLPRGDPALFHLRLHRQPRHGLDRGPQPRARIDCETGLMGEFDFSVWGPSLPFIRDGLLFTLRLTLVAMTGGIVIGTLLALARLSPIAPLARIAGAYVDLMRSIPLVLVILWFFLVIPFITGSPVGAETSAIITFTAFEAAFYCEIMRSGIQSVPRGQVNAAFALGLGRAQAMIHVILPQAVRNMLPVLLTQTIVLFQDTSLVYAIGAKDMLKAADVVGKNYNRPVEMIVLSALIYFAICFSLSLAVRQLQKRVAIIR